MAEYIDKEIVKEAIGMIAIACLAKPRITCGEIQTFFKGIPTADVRPVVRGEWICNAYGYLDEDGNVHPLWSCSNCGTVFEEFEKKPVWSYCPNCGADMRGGDAE